MFLAWSAVAVAGQVEIVAPASVALSLRCPHGEPVVLYRQGTAVDTGDQTWVTDQAPGRLCEVWLGDEPVDWIALQGRSWCDGEGCRTTHTNNRGIIWVRGSLSRPELRCETGRFDGRPTDEGWTFEAPVDPCWLWDSGKRRGDHPISWGTWVLDGQDWLPGSTR